MEPPTIPIPSRSPLPSLPALPTLPQWVTPPTAHSNHPSASTLITPNPYVGLFAPTRDYDASAIYSNKNSISTNNNTSNPTLNDTSRVSPTTLSNIATNNSNSNSNNNSDSSDNIATRQNQVGTIQLHGESIVSLIIDSKVSARSADISKSVKSYHRTMCYI